MGVQTGRFSALRVYVSLEKDGLVQRTGFEFSDWLSGQDLDTSVEKAESQTQSKTRDL